MSLLSTIGSASARAYGFTRSAIAVATDAFFNRVTLLLNTGSTNGAQNNTFLDSSTANAGSGWTITRNGNTTQGTFTPFSQTGWSNYFDGSGDYLTVPNSTAFSLPGDYTIECWWYPTSLSASTGIWTLGNDSGTNNGLSLYWSSGSSSIRMYSNATSLITGSIATPVNSWYHVALVRSGSGANNTTLYINGVSAGSVTNTTSFVSVAGNGFCIGAEYTGTYAPTLSAYFSNVRVVKGTAVYTAAFTPPTAPLTAITNTSLLTCQSNRFIDNSTANSGSGFAITPAGNTSVQAFSPFAPTAAYSTTTVGGSGYFNGSTDYLSTTNVAALQLTNATAFTIECWVYLSSVANNPSPITNYNNSSPYQGYGIRVDSATTGQWQFWDGTSWNTFGPVVKANTWTHIAITYEGSGTTRRFYVDGAQQGSASTMPSSVNYTAGTLYIGATSGGTGTITGYVSNVRIIKGTALYTGATYTIPTAPFTAVSNTSLLLNGTNAGIYDATMKNDLQTVGNAQVSTTQAKFGTTSMYFDGTGDWLIQPANQLTNLGTSDFTIEGWFYLTTTASVQNFVGTWSAAPSRGWFAYFDTTLKLSFTYSTTGSNAVDAGFGYTPSTNTWVHIAFVRSGANLYCFVDGTQRGSTHNISTSSIYANTQPLYVGERGSSTGGALNGYIDDLRITRYARYTANFSVPTAAFPVQ